MSPIFIYHTVIAAFAALIVFNSLVSFATFRKPRGYVATGGDSELPMVSILVPARNEEHNIEACITSILTLNYPNYEVIVLDDGSEDDTYAIACRLRDRDYRLRVLVGSELPDGWYGKPNACWQLANAARGEYLLFTDADCIFAPDALLLALGGMREHAADVVSLYPDVKCETFWEKLILPLMGYIVVGFLPVPMVRGNSHHWYAPANGAFLFLRRDTYFDIDGHRAVRSELAEDIKFAQNVKRRGKALWYGDGSSVYSVRMYTSLTEIVNGFTKNIFAAFSRILWLLLFVLSILTVAFVLPPIFAIWGYLHGAPWTILPALTYIGLVCVRLGLSIRFGNDNALDALLLPFAWAMVIGIALRSIVHSYNGRAEWKGRTYPHK